MESNRITAFRELEERRNAYEKLFSLGRGRRQAVSYPQPVHELIGGQWREIDCRFVEKDGAFVSSMQKRRVACMPSGAEAFVSLTDAKGNALAYGLEDCEKVLPQAEQEPPPKEHTVEAQRELPLYKTHGAVRYPNIFPEVDLVCHADSGAYKDEIVFKKDCRPVTYRFRAQGLEPRETEKGILFVNREGEGCFTLPHPLYLDAAGEARPAKTALKQTEKNEWQLTVRLADEEKPPVYPLVLDPAIYTGKYDSNIDCSYVDSGNANNNYSASTTLPLSHSESRDRIAFLRLQTLPRLDSSDYLTQVCVCLAKYAQPAEDTCVHVRALTPVSGETAWNESTVTWNTRPTAEGTHQTYVNVSHTTSFSQYSLFDITALARRWYSREVNNGVQVETQITWPNAITLVSSKGGRKPYFLFEYRSLAGLEESLAYDSVPNGRAGCAHISLANGNMVFEHADMASAGERMPVSITHWYNSCSWEQDLFGMGQGWRTSLHRTLHRETLTDAGGNSVLYYVYTDADGTAHYLEADGSKYKDTEGLGLTLTLDTVNGAASLATKLDTVFLFDLPTVDLTASNASAALKLLRSITDACGNAATITAEPGHPLRIQSVTDGAGRVTGFTYNNGLCTAMVLPHDPNAASPETLSFAYTNNRLTAITHMDALSTEYGYDSGTGLLITAKNVDNNLLTLAYNSTNYISGLPHCVVHAQAGNGTAGFLAKRGYAYQNRLCVVTDELVNGGNTPKNLYYHFNDDGYVTGVNDELGYALFAEYGQENMRKPTEISRTQKAIVNLLLDHRGTQSTSSTPWVNVTVTGSGSFSRDSSVHTNGSASRKISINANSELYCYQNVTLEPGKNYTISADIRTDETDVEGFLRVEIGNDTYTSLSAKNNTAFERYSATFSVAGSASVTAKCSLVAKGTVKGVVWFDSMQLEEGDTFSHHNLLENGNFIYGASATDQTRWSASGSSPWLTLHSAGIPDWLSGNAVEIASRYDKDYRLTQTLTMYGSAGDRFILGGWGKGFARKPRDPSICYLRVDFKYSGSDSYSYGGVAQFNWQDPNWQFASGEIKARNAYSSIRVYIMFGKQVNSMMFTNIFLYKEKYGTTRTYDAKGNCTGTVTSSNLSGGAEYDAFSNLTKARAPGKPDTVYTRYTWGTTDAEKKKHLLQTKKDPLGTTGSYTYNAYGSMLTAEVSHADAGETIHSAVSYQHSDNHVREKTDARGKSVTYDVDEHTDLVNKVTDPRNTEVHYAYDAARRVSSVTAKQGASTLSRNAYTYSDDRLATVSHITGGSDSVTYSFEYDALGRQTKTKVGTAALAETAYNDDGTVQQVTYGNSTQATPQKAVFSYDGFKRLTAARFDGDTANRYEYFYNATGQVGRALDHLLGRDAFSEYDFAGRPRSLRTFQGGDHLYSALLSYDGCDRLSAYAEEIGAGRSKRKTSFTYDNNDRPTAIAYGIDPKTTYTYDKLGRISQRKVYTTASNQYGTAYAYVPGDGTNRTTPLVASITQNGENLAYTYDDAGNILSETRGNVTVSYEYDALGQLTRVNDPNDTTADPTGTTWVYTYDQGGNILSKAYYPYTTGSLGTPTGTVTYTYGDSNWKDKLTAYNGTPISYDAIGNPTNDGTWSYVWEKGRQLKQMTSTGTTATFDYNADGLRVRKTVNNVVTNYILHGKNIVHLTQGSDSLHFYYDAQNRPAIVDYNGTLYRYIYNLQGDVLGLLDSSNNEVVQYTYDAWGKILSVTGTLASTVGTIQPFRYRGYVYDVETGLYYLRSRYYNSNWNRFVCEDNIIIPFQYSISLGLFTYCLNSPVNLSDQSGCTAVIADSIVDFVREEGMNISMADGPLPFGEIIVLGALGSAAFLYFTDWAYNALTGNTSSANVSLSQRIDWKPGDKNHILKGSKNHTPHDWSNFGIDPNDPNWWEKLLPFLWKVADAGTEYKNMYVDNGRISYMYYNFIEEGARIILKLFYNSNGDISISDAWTTPLTAPLH